MNRMSSFQHQLVQLATLEGAQTNACSTVHRGQAIYMKEAVDKKEFEVFIALENVVCEG